MIKSFEKSIILHYCPMKFYHSNIIEISHFVRNDNQLFIFGDVVRKRRSRFLTTSPIEIHLMKCHSERSDESIYFCRTIVIILLLIISFTSCVKDKVSEQTDFKTTPYQINIPKYFPSALNIPSDNPMTVEGVRLGRYLFYDGRLSGRLHPDSQMTCATCHLQANAFEVGISNPRFPGGKTFGLSGIATPHYNMALVNLVFNKTGYLWNGFINQDNNKLGNTQYGVPALNQFHYKNIESLVWMAIAAPHEINGSVDRTVKTIASIPMYPPMFKAAFGTEEVNYERISKAIAQFVRTLISSNSKFDKYLRGESNLTAEELQGYVLFTTEAGADCFHCHGGGGNPLFTTNLFYNNGKDSIFNDPKDRFAVSGINSDKGAYKAPSLRNIMLTAPYMHDGRFKNIDEVINFYSESVLLTPYTNSLMHQAHNAGVQLTLNEKNQLKAFLNTLTDYEFISDTNFSKPKNLP